MNLIDVVIVALLVGGAAFGFRQGFILEIAAMFGAVAALAVARAQYPDVRSWLASIAPHSPWLTVVAYLIVFLVVWAAINFIARRVRGMARLMMLGWVDRLGGAVLGFLQGAVVVELLLYLGRRVPPGAVRHAVRHSTLAPGFQQLVPYIHTLFPHVPA